MKKKYICPKINITEFMSENLMLGTSRVDTGDEIHDVNNDGEANNPNIEVGSKDNNDMWGNSYNVWE